MREYYDYLCKRMPEAKRLVERTIFSKNYMDQEFFNYCVPLIRKAREAVKDDVLRTFHVQNESVPLGIATITFTPDQNPEIPSKKVLVEQLNEDWNALVNYYYGNATPKLDGKGIAVKKAVHDFIEAQMPPEPGSKHPVPPEVEGKTVYEIAYNKFNRLTELKRFGLKLVDDPESPTGKAMRIGMDARNAESFHKDKLTAGFQDRSINERFHSYEFKRENLPQDEQYHFYNIGSVELHVASLFWMHRSWFIQQDFSNFYQRKGDNKYELWVSVKFTGPAYVNGSTKENVISIDRFLLVKEN
jgi:hypothetical protein